MVNVTDSRCLVYGYIHVRMADQQMMFIVTYEYTERSTIFVLRRRQWPLAEVYWGVMLIEVVSTPLPQDIGATS